MRILRNKIVMILVSFMLSVFAQIAHSEKIYGFNKVKVTKALTTLVEFDQDDFKQFSPAENLKLQVMERDKVIREDAILNDKGVWVWDKVLPFSEDLKFVIFKNDQPISTEFFANTKTTLAFSYYGASNLNIIRNIHYLPPVSSKDTAENKRLPISIPKALENCKDKVLVVVFNKETNQLLWQSYDVLKKGLTTDAIDVSEALVSRIVTDEGSCDKELQK